MLEQKKLREQNGRDTFGRYRAQVRSAAIATLSILEGKDIDRVYCDFHEDFVIRKTDGNGISYIFYQVKTKSKQNHNWTLNDLFGLNSKIKDQDKQDTKKIKDSFIGKLLLHTVVFDNYCNSVVFQTNINNGDDVLSLHKDIISGLFEDKFTKVIVDRFNSCYEDLAGKKFTVEEIREKLSKLKFETDVQYLKIGDENLEPIARDKIFKFSEIDLDYSESREILMKLLDLVERKSSDVIANITAENIEKYAGISIGDLLPILSISLESYENLLQGGDGRAIKNASIIQRTLTSAGAGDSEVEYCSRCKTDWDIWLRNNRHIISEFDLQGILSSVAQLLNKAVGNSNMMTLSKLRKPIKELVVQLEKDELLYDLNPDLVLGGVFAELVKRKS
jgi:hypothetical protein